MPPTQKYPAPPPPTRSVLLQWLYRLLALVSLGLGILGVFLPVLPTTPFILLAAWAAARSSPRLLAWLENHPLFGQMLRDWRRKEVIRIDPKTIEESALGEQQEEMFTDGRRIRAPLPAVGGTFPSGTIPLDARAGTLIENAVRIQYQIFF